MALRRGRAAEARNRQQLPTGSGRGSARPHGVGRACRQDRAGDRPMTDQLILHEYSLSGNCYKVRLAAALVGVPIQRREYDLMKGETRTPEFLANINPNGRIPVLQVGDRFIPESNAASYYVAEGSHLIPTDPFDHADMLRWMFWEQYNHEPNIATLRFWMHSLGSENLDDLKRLQMPTKRQAGNAALKLMD